MQAREMSDLFDKIRELLGIEGGFELANLTRKIEEAFAGSELFNDATKTAFFSSKSGVDGRYRIHADETNLIKSIKALLNLVSSIQSIDPKTFEKLKSHVGADAQATLYEYINLAKVGIAAYSELDHVKQVYNDINEFSFYAKKVSELFPSFPELTLEAKAKLQELRDTFLHLPISQALGAVKVEADERYREKLSERVPVINFDEILEVVDSFGLKTNVDILIEMTGRSRSSYPEVYDASLEIKKLMQEARLLAEKMGYDPRFHAPGLKWDDLSEEDRSNYIKLNSHLKLILNGYNQLKAECAKSKTLSKVINRNSVWTVPQLNVLVQWSAGSASRSIDALSTSANDAIEGVKALIVQGITPQSKKAYYDSVTNLYLMSQQAVVVDETQRNLMLLHNISVRALAVLRRFNTKSTSLISNITDKLAMLNEVGRLVSDFNDLRLAGLADGAKKFIGDQIDMMLQQFIPLFHDSISVAQEAEIRLGLKTGVLLQKLEPLSKNIQALIDRLGCKIKVSTPPFDVERKLAIDKLKNELISKLAEKEKIEELLKDEKPDLFKLLELIERLKSIHTYNAQKYINHLQLTVNKMLGVDVLESEIKRLENKILVNVKQQNFTTSIALLTSTEDEINAVLLDSETQRAIRDLRKLYVMRDQLQKVTDTIKLTKSGHRVVPIRRFEQGKLVDGVYQVKAVDVSELKKCLLEDLQVCKIKESQAIRAMNMLLPAQAMEEVPDQFMSARSISSLSFTGSASLTTSLPFVTARVRSVRRDTPLFVTAQLATSISIPPELTATQIVNAVQIDDHEIVLSVINKENGAIILQSEAARKNLIAYALRVLSDKQKAQFSLHKLNDSLNHSDDDLPLTSAVKRMYNTMLNFELLMRHVNKLQKILSGNYLGYRKIPALLGLIKEAIKNLSTSTSEVNASFLYLRQYFQDKGLLFGEFDLFNMLSSIVGELPAQLQSVVGQMQGGLIDRLDVGLAKSVKQLAEKGAQLKGRSHDLSLSAGPASSLVLVNNSFSPLVAVLKQQLQAFIPNPDGTYDLTKFENNSPLKCVAALVNASYKLLSVLNAAERYSNGSTISGLIDVVKGLYSAYSLINESNFSGLAREAKEMLGAQYNMLKAFLEKQAKECLGRLIPIARKMAAQASRCENELGLRDDIILENINPYIEKLVQLGKLFKVEEAPAVDTDVFQTALIAPSDLTRQASSIAQRKNPLNDWKVQQLFITCADYKHHLAEALSMELEKAYPGQYFPIDINAKFNISPSLVNNHPVLKLTIEKYNAVQDLQAILRSPLSSSNTKIDQFNIKLRSFTTLLGRNRDSAAISFLKWVATILTAGIAALFGIWRTQGDDVSDKMKLVASQPAMPRSV